MISPYGGRSLTASAKPHVFDCSERMFDRQITFLQVFRLTPEVLASTP